MEECNFTPEEWLSVVSFMSPSKTGLRKIMPPFVDPAAQLRVERPLTRAALLKDTSRNRLLHSLLRLQFAVESMAARPFLRHSLAVISAGLQVALLFLNDGRFMRKQLKAGGVCLIGSHIVIVLLVSFGGFGIRNVFSVTASRKEAMAKSKDEEAKPEELSGHALAGLVRWWQGLDCNTKLGDLEGAKDVPNLCEELLLAHSEGDALCPCHLATCAGGIEKQAGFLHVLDIIFWFLFVCLGLLIQNWTTVVTFAPQYFVAVSAFLSSR